MPTYKIPVSAEYIIEADTLEQALALRVQGTSNLQIVAEGTPRAAEDETRKWDLDEWERVCDVVKYGPGRGPEGGRAEWAMDDALNLLACARNLAGVACKACSGSGVQTYSSTSTWRGGIGGQQITSGVCDRCWGSGRSDVSGPNLRKLLAGVQAK